MQPLPFVQLDLAGELALADGRYLVREPAHPDAEPDVLALRTLGARRARSRLRRGRPVPLDSEPEPTPLRLSRLTLIKAIPFDGEQQAERWLKRIARDEELARGLSAEVAAVANRALIAHRVAAPDPYAADIHPGAAVTVRFGYGSGDEVAEGRWSAARELPEAARRGLRAEIIDSVGAQERVAAVLGGRDEVAPFEALLVDAERAAEQNRSAIAVLTLDAALDALVRSGADDGGVADAAGALRERALSGGEIDPASLRETLRAARRAIRAFGAS